MLGLFVLFVIGLATALFVAIGMLCNDVAEIRAQRTIKKHPNARRLRERPTIHIVINGTVSDECLASIRRNRYRKLIVSQADTVPIGALVLVIDGNTVLEPNSIREAVRKLLVQQEASANVTPGIARIGNTFQLFRAYATLAGIPFTMAKSGLGIVRTKTFALPLTVFKFMNLLLFVYACYAAAELRQPELVLVYLAALGFWLAWAILRYPYLRPVEKLGLFMLMPVSFVYFIYRTVAAPFESDGRQADRRNVIIRT